MSHLTSGAFLTKIFLNFCHPQELFSTTTSSNSHQKRERDRERERGRARATTESVRRGGEFQKARRERERKRGNERACVRVRPTESEPERTKANITSVAFFPLHCPPDLVLPPLASRIR
ncbi:hypothetical protein QQF64_022151 [Cirrhinus molitorella]|uniref:Uncharacterized protein n=1 Tax=Cirrhinus molitorella TaxID=172907 RepID=A0ABR3L7M7_9TELE